MHRYVLAISIIVSLAIVLLTVRFNTSHRFPELQDETIPDEPIGVDLTVQPSLEMSTSPTFTESGNESLSSVNHPVETDTTNRTQATEGSEDSNLHVVETDTTKRQQERYAILAELLPRYHEAAQVVRDMEKRRPRPVEWPDDREEFLARIDEALAWNSAYRAFQDELEGPLLKKHQIQQELARLFPEAIESSKYGFAIDYRVLRELVGGRLPTDE